VQDDRQDLTMRHQQQHTPAGMWTAKRRPAALLRGSSGPRPRAGRRARPPQWGGQPLRELALCGTVGAIPAAGDSFERLFAGAQGVAHEAATRANLAAERARLASRLQAHIAAVVGDEKFHAAVGAGVDREAGHVLSPVWASHRALPMSSNVPMLDTLRKRRFVTVAPEAGRPNDRS